MVIDQVLPDGHGIAPVGERVGDDLAIDLMRSRWARRSAASPSGRWTPSLVVAGFAGESVDTRVWPDLAAATPAADRPRPHGNARLHAR